MLYITGKRSASGTVGYTKHIGDQALTEILKNLAEYIDAGVLCVQADGDELKHILTMLPLTVPRTDNHIQRWYGDHARFILGNW